ncbi:MAG: M56 family metallopeptidase [Rhodothermales bacterium]
MDSPLFSPAFTREAFVVLIDYALKGALILTATGLLMYALRQSSAALRHAVWGVALALVLLIPIAPLVVPGLQVGFIAQGVLPGEPAMTALEVPAEAEIAYVPANGKSYFVYNADETTRATMDPEVTALLGNEVSPNARIVRPPAGGSAYLYQEREAPVVQEAMDLTAAPLLESLLSFVRSAGWTDWVLLTWLGGIVFLLGWMLSGIVGLFWLRQRSMPLEGEAWQDLVDEIAERYALRRTVTLMTSGRIAMPMTWGLWRPVVLLPVDAEDWPAERRRSVLLHEIAHIARWDYATQTFAYAVCAVNWFNPLVWRASNRMRLEQEKACDDRVLSHGMKATDYATHLMDLARTVRSAFVSPAAAMSMARPSQLEGRVVSILDDRRDRQAPSWKRVAGTVAAAIALILPLAAMQVWQPEVYEVSMAADAPGEFALAEVPAVAEVPSVPRLFTQPESLADIEVALSRQPVVVWSDPDTTDEDRRVARQKAIKALRSALKDENVDIRRDAVVALAQIGGDDMVDAFSEVVRNDPSVEVRRQAVLALSRIEGDAANAGLTAALSDADRDVRRQALMGLSNRNVAGSVSVFRKALQDDDAIIRETAVRALGMRPGKEAVEVLSEVLVNDRSRDVRIAAARSLGAMRDIRAVDALSDAMEDEDVEVRRVAAQALSQLNYEGDGRPTVVGKAFWGSVGAGSPATLTTPSADVIYNAARLDALRSTMDSSRTFASRQRAEMLQNQLAEYQAQSISGRSVFEVRSSQHAQDVKRDLEAAELVYHNLLVHLTQEQDAEKKQEIKRSVEELRARIGALSNEIARLQSRTVIRGSGNADAVIYRDQVQELQITELIGLIEQNPAGVQCKEAMEKLEALKDVNSRARIAVDTLSCEKE